MVHESETTSLHRHDRSGHGHYGNAELFCGYGVGQEFQGSGRMEGRGRIDSLDAALAIFVVQEILDVAGIFRRGSEGHSHEFRFGR